MRTMIFIALLSFFSTQIFAGEGEQIAYNQGHGALHVNIDGLSSENGKLMIHLFNNEAGFPNQEWNALYVIDLDISTDGNSMVFKSIPFGDYAIYVYHDENSNGKFDKNWAGVAKEAFAYSNRAETERTVPLFSQSVFAFEKNDMELNLQLVPAKKSNKQLVSSN